MKPKTTLKKSFEYYIDYLEQEDGKWKKLSVEKKIELLADAVHMLLFKCKDLFLDIPGN